MADQIVPIEQLARDYAGVAALGLPRILEEQPEAAARMRAIGEDLYAQEGLDGLRDAIVMVHRLTDGVFPTGADFNRLWDGVGDWRV